MSQWDHNKNNKKDFRLYRGDGLGVVENKRTGNRKDQERHAKDI